MNQNYFLTICLNPVLQKTIFLPALHENRVNRSSEHYFDASGKGINVSRALAQLGEKVCHITQAGGNNRGLFLRMAEADHIPVEWTNSGSEIRFCYTLINREKQTVTEIVEEAEEVMPDTEERIYGLVEKRLHDCCAVIISGTKAKGFSLKLYPRIVADAKKAGKPVILDYRDRDLVDSLPFSPDVVKPNLEEFTKTFFPGLITENADKKTILEQVKAKMLAIRRDFKTIVILTDGKNPLLYTDGESVKSITPEVIVPVNTTGCGDSFTAGFAREYLRSRDAAKAIACGLDASRRNALTPRPGYLQQRL